MRKHNSLQKMYYIRFASMIVIPILLVFTVSLSIIRIMMENSAISAIQSSQNTIVSSLTESIKDASLQLSHFIYVNNNEAMEIAAMTDTDNVSLRHTFDTRLDKLFQTAMAPKQTVISGMIYMKDGHYTYLKQEMILPKEQVMTSEWYQKALASSNTIAIGSYDTSNTKLTMTGSRSRELILAVAMSPDIGVDRSGKIDMIVLFFKTNVGNLLHRRNSTETLKNTVILDQDGTIIFKTDHEESLSLLAQELCTESSGVYHRHNLKKESRGTYSCVVSEIPETQWRIISCVKTSTLTKKFNQIVMLVLIVLAALFALYIAFSRLFLQNIIQPVYTMMNGFRQIEEGNLTTHIVPAGDGEIRQMIHSFNRMVRQLRTSVEENEAAQKKKLEAEVRALQSQMNPHFLVNTLNSIRFMAQVSKFDGIRKMAEALIQILTCSFRSNSSFYTVKEELDVLDSYLYLMKIRYSDGFDVSYEIEESCLECKIPRLILQPIVENSIVHGFTDMEEEMGQIVIRVEKEEEKLYLEVWDNGCGMSKEQTGGLLEKKNRRADDNYSIGIENVCSRLKLHFKEEFQIQIASVLGEYTRIRLILPAIETWETDMPNSQKSERTGTK